MSYNLVIIALLLIIPIVGLLVFFSYRQGLKDARAIKEERPLKPIIESKTKKIEQDKDLKRRNAILENVNSYNGSPVGQKDVR